MVVANVIRLGTNLRTLTLLSLAFIVLQSKWFQSSELSRELNDACGKHVVKILYASFAINNT